MHCMTLLYCISSHAIHSPASWGPLGSSPLPEFLIDWRDGPEFWCWIMDFPTSLFVLCLTPLSQVTGLGREFLVGDHPVQTAVSSLDLWCSQSCSGHFWTILRFLMPNRLFLWFDCFLDHTKATS